MKKLLYFFVGCILVGFALSFIFASLPVFPYTSQGFLNAVANNQDAQAYELLSDQFKKKYDLATFKAAMQQSGLKAYSSVRWVKNITDAPNKIGFVAGVMITKNKSEIPIKIEFIQIGDNWLNRGWRINAIVVVNQRISGDDVKALPQQPQQIQKR